MLLASMASQVVHLPETEVDSLCSTPRSDNQSRWNEEFQPPPRVSFMCSFGGRILPRPHDDQLRYVGGETRIVAVPRSTTFAALLAKLAKLSGSADFTVKYQLPTEDLDALISVSTDEDVDNMMEEYDRLRVSLSLSASAARTPRLRLFLFPHGGSRSSSISSLLDGIGAGSSKQWFLDALNGSGGGASLERVLSEVSSVVSEVPDYLFGLDTESSETTTTRARSRVSLGRSAGGSTGQLGGGGKGIIINSEQDMSVVSDTGSPPAPPDVEPSPYCSISSTTLMPPPDLPPVKTKIETAIMKSSVDDHDANHVRFNNVEQRPPAPQVQHTSTGYASAGNNIPILMWPPGPQHHYYQETHLHGQAVQQVPVYYLPAAGNVPVRPVQMPLSAYNMQGVAGQPTNVYGGQPMMGNPMGAPPAAVPVYGGQILRPGEYDLSRAPAEGGQVFYGQRAAGVVQAYAPAGVMPVGVNGADQHHVQAVNQEPAKTG